MGGSGEASNNPSSLRTAEFPTKQCWFSTTGKFALEPFPLENLTYVLQSVNYLKKCESFTVNKIIVALDTMNLGKVLFLAYADGSVEYRDRLTMAETFNDGDLDRVWHLSQIGFSYPEDEPCAY